jgi:serine/threonine protein kinase/Tol biopolymer transport system component
VKQGQMLAHYKVEEKIGAGGMGEVYRAHDSVLDRDVALKILPQEFAADSERTARFQREAKVLASLQHQNIASIFGFESTPECTFLVMELVEGEDLSEPLKTGPLPMDEAVDVARQIAEGLEEAHEKGIIHRDLKPANIKRMADGRVKILDFGLARAFSGQTATEEQISSAPTMTAAMTQVGTVMGTAAYMSPEQARGKEVDRRADIWAFGVLLYEMLTGEQLFSGETMSDTMAGILKTEPEWDDLPDNLPHQVERVLRRCLAKDPRQRLRDIGEARVRLENPAAESGIFSGPVDIADTPVARRRNLVPWGLLALSLAATLWLAVGRADNTVEPPILHTAIPSPELADFAVSGSYPGLPVISPQGKHIVFSAKSEVDGTIRLYSRSMASGKAVALDGTEDAQYPFWSPDGQWIAFFDRNEGLKKIMVGGGPAQPICPAGNGKGGSWNEAGEIIFTAEYNSHIQIVAAVGGEPRPVTDLAGDEGIDSHRHPQFLPDGRKFLYMARGAGGRDSEIRMASLDGGPHKVVMNVSTMGQYASGHLLFLNQQTLMTQPFDPVSGELSSAPIPVAEDVMVNDPADENFPVWQPDGRALYFVSDRTGHYALYRQELGRTGEEELVFALDTPIFLWDCSNDGRTILYSTTGEGTALDLWCADLTGETEPRLLRQTSADDGAAYFSPDGNWISFWSEESGDGQVYLAPYPGISPISQVSTTTGGWSFWNPNNRELIYQDQSGRLLAVPLTPEGQDMIIGMPVALFDHASPKLEGAWLDLSADGERFLAVDSDASDPPPFCDIVINWPAQLHLP